LYRGETSPRNKGENKMSFTDGSIVTAADFNRFDAKADADKAAITSRPNNARTFLRGDGTWVNPRTLTLLFDAAAQSSWAVGNKTVANITNFDYLVFIPRTGNTATSDFRDPTVIPRIEFARTNSNARLVLFTGTSASLSVHRVSDTSISVNNPNVLDRIYGW